MRSLMGLLLVPAFLTFSLGVAAGEKHGITEITLRRCGGSDGKRPVDELTFRSDGTARYVGKSNVQKIGEFTGRIPDLYFGSTFDNLAEAYIAASVAGLNSKPTMNTTIVCLVVIRDGKKLETTDNCPGSDSKLFTIEMAILGIALDIEWKKRG